MGGGEDARGEGTLSAMLEIELHGGARAFNRGQRIDHDHAALALDQRHVGDIEAPDLIDAGHDLEESMVHVETRLPPQARPSAELFLRKESRMARGSRPPCPAPT